jgi:hypothetical protein
MSALQVYCATGTAACPALLIVPGAQSLRFRSIFGALAYADQQGWAVINRATVERIAVEREGVRP